VELLEGWIVQKMPRNPPHDAVISVLHNRVLNPKLPPGRFCRGQSAIVTDAGKPEPDIAIVRGSELDYLDHHPRPRDLASVIEVSDTTLADDRAIKGPSYARVAIPVYWIVNLVDLQVEVYSDPTGADPTPAYRFRQDYRPGEQVPLVISGQTIALVAVNDMLPGIN
jgi:Uma2 family endonuclease